MHCSIIHSESTIGDIGILISILIVVQLPYFIVHTYVYY